MTTGTATDPEITRAFIAGPLASAVRVLTVTARPGQESAAAAHTSQSEALPVLIKRLDQLGSVETLRWLVSPGRVPAQRVGP